MKLNRMQLMVKEMLEAHEIEAPDEIDIERIAASCNAEIRYARLDSCAANLIGIADQAIITVDRSASYERTRFSIAHELAHWKLDRKKGLFLCEQADLNSPWTGKGKKTSSIEKRANLFAAELLMPIQMFTDAVRQELANFHVVEDARNLFKTSRTSTAIRLVEHGSFPSMLISYNLRNGKREWFIPSPDLPPRFYPHQLLLRDTKAWELTAKNGGVMSELEEVDGSSWIDHERSFEFTITEHAIRVRDSILVLLCWPDDTVIDELS